MSIRDRLNRLTGETAPSVREDSKQARISDLRKKINEIMGRREHLAGQPPPRSPRDAVALGQAVFGEEMETSRGKFFISRCRLQSQDLHGHTQIGSMIHPDMEAVAFLTGSDDLKRFTMEDALFLDTETTGLAGGTGTFPFLIGLGWFEDGGFITHQLFARDFSEEPAMLAYLCELASKRRFMVTFNGKSYDLNLLAARFILNRCRDLLSALPHCDLLHPSRRIYSRRMENVRLVTLETAVLGVRRSNDVPGHEIPGRYFDWLRRKDGSLLADVFLHNRLDIVSMASLLKHLTDMLAKRPDTAYANHSDLLAVAKLHFDRGNLPAASRLYADLTGSQQPGIAQSARRMLSLVCKKTRRWQEAVSLWKEMIASDPHDVFAAEELAKWYEHHVRRYDLAEEIVRSILDGGKPLAPPHRPAMAHRLQRLTQKRTFRPDHPEKTTHENTD